MSFFASTVAGGLEEQVVQVAGALCVLAGFAAAQWGLLTTRSRIYLVLNLIGSALLAVLAALDRQPGLPAPGGRMGARVGLVADRPHGRNDEDPVVTGSSALACYGRSRTRTWDLFLIREAL
jgi:hypothetical protein